MFLSLSNYWNVGELNQLVQTKIIGNNQISPATYEEGEFEFRSLSCPVLTVIE